MGNIVSYLKDPFTPAATPAAAPASTTKTPRTAQTNPNQPTLALTTSTTLTSLTGHTLSFNFSASLHPPARTGAHPPPPAPTNPNNIPIPLFRAKPHNPAALSPALPPLVPPTLSPPPHPPSSTPISPKTILLHSATPQPIDPSRPRRTNRSIDAQMHCPSCGDIPINVILGCVPCEARCERCGGPRDRDRDRLTHASGTRNKEDEGEGHGDRERNEACEEHWAGEGVPLPKPEDVRYLWSTREAQKPLRRTLYSTVSLREICRACGGRGPRRMSPRRSSWEKDGEKERYIEGRWSSPVVKMATDLSEAMRNRDRGLNAQRAREWEREREGEKKKEWNIEWTDPKEGFVRYASDLGDAVNDRVRDVGKWRARDRPSFVNHDDSEDDRVFVPRLRRGLQHRSPKSNSNVSSAFDVNSSTDSLPIPSLDPPPTPSPSQSSSPIFNLGSETIARYEVDLPPLPIPRGESLGSSPDFAPLVSLDPFTLDAFSRADSVSSFSFGSVLSDSVRGEVGQSGSSSSAEGVDKGEDPFSDGHAFSNVVAGGDDGNGRVGMNHLKRKRDQHSLGQEEGEEGNVYRRRKAR